VKIFATLALFAGSGALLHFGQDAGGFLGQFGLCSGAEFVSLVPVMEPRTSCPVPVISMSELSRLHYCKYRCKKI
jgi:hypothetical protein